MKTINVEGVLPIFNGFTDTSFDPCYAIDLVLEETGKDARDFKFDYKEYCERVAESAINFVNSNLPKGLFATFDYIYYPKQAILFKEEIHVIYKMTLEFYSNALALIVANQEDFDDFLSKTYHKRTPFHPASLSDFLDLFMFTEERMASFALYTFLDWYFTREQIDSCDMADAINDDVCYIEYETN